MDGVWEWVGPDGYVVSTDPGRLDIDRIHRFLSTAYWSTGIPRDVVQRSIAGSLPFGLYAPSGEQAGFARVVTDRATYAYLGDVYVESAHRGRGLGKFLVSCVLAHPELQGLRPLGPRDRRRARPLRSPRVQAAGEPRHPPVHRAHTR